MPSFVRFGKTVKTMDEQPGKIGGLLVYYTDAKNKDLDEEYFTPETYLGAQKGNGVDTIFHHGQPLRLPAGVDAAQKARVDALSRKILPPVKTTLTDVGLWADVVLDLSDEYEKAVYDLAAAGRLSWSSGAVGHLVEKEPDGKITRWIIGEASLTPTPARPFQKVFPAEKLGSIKTIDWIGAGSATKDFSAADTFQSAVDAQQITAWNLECIYRDTLDEIAEYALAAQTLGQKFDFQSEVQAATDLYAAELVQSVVAQLTEYLDSGGEDYGFYLKARNLQGLQNLSKVSLDQHAPAVVSAVGALVSRFKANREIRAKSGRQLSAANRDRLTACLDQMRPAIADMEALLSETETETAQAKAKALSQSLRLRSESLKLRINL